MREALDRILSGIFNNDIHSLDFSTPVIELGLHAGEQYEGSFFIYGPANALTEGTVSSTRLRMQCLINRFTGSREEIPYSFDANGMAEGDSLKGEFRIVSNQGEYFIPYEVKIEANDLDSSLGNIKNLFHFTNLARTNWTEAVHLFYSPEFEKILCGVDRQYINTYHGLCGGDRNEQHLEEFLLEIKKKQPVEFLLEESEIRMDTPKGEQEGTIVITRNGWGFSELTIHTEADFITLEKEVIRDEDFLGNGYRLPFYVSEEKLHAGRNFGEIHLTSAYCDLKVTVIAMKQQVGRKLVDIRRQKNHATMELMQYYEAFRLKRISASSWLNETNKIVEHFIELDDNNLTYKLFRVQLLITEERINEAEWLLGQLENVLTSDYDITLYCYFLYLSTLLNRREEYIDEVAGMVEQMFIQNADNWRIAWLMLYLSEDYSRSPSKKWLVLEEQFQKGANSPIIYIEAVNLLLTNPTLLMQLGSFEIQVLLFAAKRELLGKELVDQLLYLSQKQKQYHARLLRILCACYTPCPTDEVLQAICTMLINGNRTDSKAFAWYAKAIDKELRITRLYEYYMMSITLADHVVIPRIVLMYFAFDSTLDSLHNSFLYAYVYKNKALYPELYESYREQIERFVVFQILKKKNNRWLAYLYRNLITEGMITDEISEGLSVILFTYQINVKRSDVNRIFVTYERMRKELVYAVSGQEIFIPLYGSNYRITLEDTKGNRFCREEEYELTRLLIPDKLAAMIRPYVKNQVLFDLWICEHGRDMASVSEDNVDSMRRIMHSDEIKEEVVHDIQMHLLSFFYDKDRMKELDDSLNELTLDQICAAHMTQIVRYMIIRGMYEKAYEWITVCGGEDIEAIVIVRLCSRLIALEGMNENETLSALILRAFHAGKYDENLLNYLCHFFQGTVREMRDIWKAAESFSVDTYELSERILIQLLYTGAFVGEIIPIFQSYIRSGPNTKVELAFLAQASYDYFVKDKVTDPFMLEEMERVIQNKEDLPFVCKLAYTRYYAEHKKDVDEKKSRILMGYLREILNANIYFPYFKEYAENITFMHKYLDKTMVEYKVKEGNHAVIHYLIERDGNTEGEYIKEEMQDMFYGICVKQFVLFFGERLQYYVVEVEDDQEQLTESGTYSRSDTDMNRKVSRYNLINDIVISKTLDDYDTAEKLLVEYYDHMYLLNELFTMK